MITSDRFSYPLLFALSVVGLSSYAGPAAAELTLVGEVVDSSDQPIAGASVFISTAAPRVGIGIL